MIAGGLLVLAGIVFGYLLCETSHSRAAERARLTDESRYGKLYTLPTPPEASGGNYPTTPKEPA